MAVNDLVVGATTHALPAPMQNGYSEEVYNKGSAHRMADGSLARESVSAGLKVRVTYEWSQLTNTQRLAVLAAAADLLDGTSGTLTTPTGATVTVVLAENGLPTWTIRKRLGTSTHFYSGSLKLEQV
jgi:hypothetical protein